MPRRRVDAALRRRANWEELVKFCVVGASGYVVNLAVYTLLLRGADLHYVVAAIGSFLVAVTNNYTWNRRPWCTTWPRWRLKVQMRFHV